MKKEEFIFCPLGGSGEIGMNVNLYGCQGRWIEVFALEGWLLRLSLRRSAMGPGRHGGLAAWC